MLFLYIRIIYAAGKAADAIDRRAGSDEVRSVSAEGADLMSGTAAGVVENLRGRAARR